MSTAALNPAFTAAQDYLKMSGADAAEQATKQPPAAPPAPAEKPPAQQDWFAENAPAQAQGGDWFSENAPSSEGLAAGRDWLRENEKGEPTELAKREDLLSQIANAPHWYDAIIPSAKLAWENSNIIGQSKLAFDVAHSYLEHRLGQMHQENLEAAAAGKPLPHSQLAEFLTGTAGSLAGADVSASQPKNLALMAGLGLGGVPASVAATGLGLYAGIRLAHSHQALQDLLTKGQANPDELENELNQAAMVTGGAGGVVGGEVGATAGGKGVEIPGTLGQILDMASSPARMINFGRQLLGMSIRPEILDVEPSAAVTQPARAVTNRDVISQADKEGVSITPSEATNQPLSRGMRGLGERSIIAQNKLIEAEEAERAKHLQAVTALAWQEDPAHAGMDMTPATVGEVAQRDAQTALDVAKENAGQTYKEVQEKQADMAGSTKPLLDFVESQSAVRQPHAALAVPEYKTPAVRAALADVKAQADEAGPTPSIQSMRNLRTHFYERANDYSGTVPDSAKTIYAQAENIVDQQMLMKRAAGTPFEEPFRQASFEWARLKDTFDRPGSTLARILQQRDPEAVGKSLLTRKSVTDMQQLRQLGMEATLDALKHRVIVEAANRGFSVTGQGLAGYSDPFLRELFAPVSDEVKNPLWGKLAKDPSVRYGSFDDEGLRKAAGIPDSVNLSRLANEGQIIRNGKGRWIVPREYRPDTSLSGPAPSVLRELYRMAELGRRMRFEINPSGTSNVLLENEQVGELTRPWRLAPPVGAAAVSMPRPATSYLPAGEGVERTGPARIAPPKSAAPPQGALPEGFRPPPQRNPEGGFVSLGRTPTITPEGRSAISNADPGSAIIVMPDGTALSGQRSAGGNFASHSQILGGMDKFTDVMNRGAVRIGVGRAGDSFVQISNGSTETMKLAKEAIDALPVRHVYFDFAPGNAASRLALHGSPKEVIAGINRFEAARAEGPKAAPAKRPSEQLGRSALERLLSGERGFTNFGELKKR